MPDLTRSLPELSPDPRASRRSFLKIAGIGGAVLVASGCDSDTPDPIDPGDFSGLTGTVVSSTDNNQPLDNVTITVEGTSRSAVTDENGNFMIENLPAGTYTVVATGANFQVGTTENVTIGADGNATVNFTLDPGGDIVFDFSLGDITVLNFAYGLEQLEAAFYAAVVASPYDGMNADEQAIMQDLAAHEGIHRDFFEAAIIGAGGTFSDRTLLPGLTPNFEDIDFSDRDTVLATAQTFEDLGVGAYNGAGRFIEDTGYLLLAGKIVSVEARHASVISGLITANTIAADGVIDGDGLDRAISPADVLSAAQPFIVNRLSIA